MATMVEFTCERCGGTRRVTKNKSGAGRFCSKECFFDRNGTEARKLYRGYWWVRLPRGHAHARRTNRRRSWVAEHVLIAEQALGRLLRRGEVVHHLDGNKLNNQRSNLLVCTQSYHNWLHSRMSYLYQREHFAQAA